jgi:PAS domain S-box-containing protein
MVKAESTTVIERPLAAVFEFVAGDFFRNYPRWSPEVVELAPLSSGPLRVGSMARQVRVDRGRRTESTFRVTQLEPPRALAFQGVSAPYVIAYAFEPAGAHTRLTFGFQLLRLELYLRPFEKLIRAAVRDGVLQTTRNLKALAERELPAAASGAPAGMAFAPQKGDGLIPFVLTQILDTCVNGITLADPDLPDQPIVYANAAFERITGYAQPEIVGRNCRFLHREDRDQPGLAQIRAALKGEHEVTVVLRNYRRSGELFHNRLSIRPLRGQDGRLLYHLGVQYDVSAEIRAEGELQRLAAQLEKLGRG